VNRARPRSNLGDRVASRCSLSVAHSEVHFNAEYQIDVVCLSLEDSRAGLLGKEPRPLKSPLFATIDWINATERALPCPFDAGISASRHHRCRGQEKSIGGDVHERNAIEFGSNPSRTFPSPGITKLTRGSSDSGRPRESQRQEHRSLQT